MAIHTYDPKLNRLVKGLRLKYPNHNLHGEISGLNSKSELEVIANQLVVTTQWIKDKKEQVLNYCRLSSISNDILMDYFKPFVEEHLRTVYRLKGTGIMIPDYNDITVAYKPIELPNGLVVYINEMSDFFKYHISINLQTLKHL